MSVLVYAESWNGKFRKSTFEAVSYASETARLKDTHVVAIAFGDISEEELGKLGVYGANKVLYTKNVSKGDSEITSNLFAENLNDADTIIFSNTYTTKMAAPRLAIKLNAAIISNVIDLPKSINPILINRKVFSGKGIETTVTNSKKTILLISPNSFKLIENPIDCTIETINNQKTGRVRIEGSETTTGKISLAEAEIIVSAGRGLKGPENWDMIEELADLLGGATACSKPVSDIGWRPHTEHVGQTGKVVAPNLYIAIGISGAIQHLAGVNSSKIMVVINTDPEAPFFKAADYGIIGDAFDIVPKLIQEITNLKN